MFTSWTGFCLFCGTTVPTTSLEGEASKLKCFACARGRWPHANLGPRPWVPAVSLLRLHVHDVVCSVCALVCLRVRVCASFVVLALEWEGPSWTCQQYSHTCFIKKYTNILGCERELIPGQPSSAPLNTLLCTSSSLMKHLA